MNSTRRAIAASLGLAVALTLSACSGTSADADAPAADAASVLPAAEGSTAYPLTVDTQWGEIVIDERPERVIAADHWEIDLLAALGVTPVGTNDQVEMRNYALSQLPAEIESTWPVDDVWYPAEPIAATDPDLIVILSDPAEPDNYEALSAIAPVLGAVEPGDVAAPWQDRLRLLGEVLDLSERAETVIADDETYFEQVRTDHPEFAGKTAAFLHYWGEEAGGAYLSTPDSGPEQLLSAFGFDVNPDAERYAEIEDLSAELIGSIEADVIILTSAATPEETAAFVDAPLFQSLAAVQDGRLLVLETDNTGPISRDGAVVVENFGHLGWAIGASAGPVPTHAIADFLVPLLAEVAA